MKLLFCKVCQDLIKLDYEIRTCKCGNGGGKYINSTDAEYFGSHAVPMGIANGSLRKALTGDNTGTRGERVEAFIITDNCKTYVKNNNLTKGE